MALSTLINRALLGTARDAAPWSSDGTALDDAITQLSENDRESRLLSALAVTAQYEQTGQQVARTEAALAAPAEDDKLSTCSSKAVQHLRSILDGTFTEALPEWLAALTRVGKRVTPQSLVDLLSYTEKHPETASLIIPVLDQRGHWLMNQNPDWNFASEKLPDTSWETGTREERLRWLEQTRQRDPKAGRELLEGVKEEGAFVAKLAIGLSMEDEPYLESLLDDKRKEVRRTAAELLAQLSASRLVQRMIARTEPLISITKPTLKLGKRKLEVTPPEACDKAMQRDGINPKPGQSASKLGEKAVWLAEMLEAVPLSVWTAKLGQTPAQLFELALANDWKEALIQGWAKAMIAQRDPAWAEAYLSNPKIWVESIDVPAQLLAPARLEEAIIARLEKEANKNNYNNPAMQILGAAQHQWSYAFTEYILNYFVKMYYFPSQLAYYMHLNGEALAGKILQELPSANPYWRKLVETLQFRNEMLKEINA